jgi:hypothetical protein
VAVSVLALGAAPAAGATHGRWKPTRLARVVVTANLKKASPGFTPSVGPASCTGQATVAHCTVTASVSNDDVTAKVTFTRHRDGTHLRYVDKLTFVAVMGGGTVTRSYYGKILA